MSLSNLSSAQLARLIGLIKEKESLQAKLDKVEVAIAAIEGDKAPAKRGRKPGRPPGSKSTTGESGRKSRRLKDPILKLLSTAGSSGLTVKELSNKLKVKPGNIFSFFYTTGRKISGLKKVGEAKYAYTA
jgi:hypothetical protein